MCAQTHSKRVTNRIGMNPKPDNFTRLESANTNTQGTQTRSFIVWETKLVPTTFQYELCFLYSDIASRIILCNDSLHFCRASLHRPAKEDDSLWVLLNEDKLITRCTITKISYVKYEANTAAVIQKLLPLLTNANLEREVSGDRTSMAVRIVTTIQKS